MRTLDEVIKAFEMCIQSPDESGPMCPGCPYADKCGDPKCIGQDKEDALHYLYELKLFRQTPMMQGIHKIQKDYALYPVSDWGEDEPDFNPPLRWDEIRQMDEKPVWLEVKNGEKKWVLIWIHPDNVDEIYITDCYGLRGKLNQIMYCRGEIKAYRKEQKWKDS